MSTSRLQSSPPMKQPARTFMWWALLATVLALGWMALPYVIDGVGYGGPELLVFVALLGASFTLWAMTLNRTAWYSAWAWWQRTLFWVGIVLILLLIGGFIPQHGDGGWTGPPQPPN
jgi:hypothetical protein